MERAKKQRIELFQSRDKEQKARSKWAKKQQQKKKSSMIMAPTSWLRKAMIPKPLLVKSGVSVIPHQISGLITVNVL